MAQGRKKKPDQLKVIQGTFRSDRCNKNAPKPKSSGMEIPGWLPSDCHEYFKTVKERIGAFKIDSESWTEAAAMIAMRMREVVDCTDIIREEGRTYRSEKTEKDGSVTVLIKGHPAVSQRSEAMRHLQSLFSEFGLTPSAISKVKSGKSEADPTDPWTLLLCGQKHG